MWLELPALWIALLNILLIPAAHLGISVWAMRLPITRFRPEGWLYRNRDWEKGGAFYERVFAVRRWKDSLPDAGPWFAGFSKKGLNARSWDYYERFLQETCRGEFAHWVQLWVIASFVMWNPWPANLIIVAYAVLSNSPCLVVQRYTRARLVRLLAKGA